MSRREGAGPTDLRMKHGTRKYGPRDPPVGPTIWVYRCRHAASSRRFQFPSCDVLSDERGPVRPAPPPSDPHRPVRVVIAIGPIALRAGSVAVALNFSTGTITPLAIGISEPMVLIRKETWTKAQRARLRARNAAVMDAVRLVGCKIRVSGSAAVAGSTGRSAELQAAHRTAEPPVVSFRSLVRIGRRSGGAYAILPGRPQESRATHDR